MSDREEPLNPEQIARIEAIMRDPAEMVKRLPQADREAIERAVKGLDNIVVIEYRQVEAGYLAALAARAAVAVR